MVGGEVVKRVFDMGANFPRTGEPCPHPGCLSHRSHPCEECGRIAGFPVVVDPGLPEGTVILRGADGDTVAAVNVGRETGE